MTGHLLVCGVGAGMERSLAEIHEADLRTTVVTSEPAAAAAAGAGQVVHAYPRDLRAVRAALADVDLGRVDGVLSLGYENPPVVAALTAELGGHGISPDVARACTIKDERIRLLEAAGVRVPRFRTAASHADGVRAVAELGCPAVVKPVDLTSSIGVRHVRSSAEADEAVQAALAVSPAGRVVVEEYLEGTEHTVEGLHQHGRFVVTGLSDRNYSEKHRFPPHFFENGDTLPSRLAPDVRAAVLAACRRAVEALELDPAVWHCDVLVTVGGEVVLLEVAGRMSGARFGTELVPLSTGVGLLADAVRIALGETVATTPEPPLLGRPVLLRYLPAPAGRVVAVGELPDVRDDWRVYDLFWEQRPVVGEVRHPFRSGKDVMAGVITTAATVEAAEQAAAEVLSAIDVRTAGHDQRAPGPRRREGAAR